MDELIDACMKIIQTQGIVAFLLLLQMWLSSRERAALLHKNCELNRFIMKILEQKINEDSPLSKSVSAYPKSSNSNDLPSEAIITQPAGKVS